MEGGDATASGKSEAVRDPSPTPAQLEPVKGQSGRVLPVVSGVAANDATSKAEDEAGESEAPDEEPPAEDLELSSSEKLELSMNLRTFVDEAIVSHVPKPSGLEGIDSGGNWWYGGAVGQD